MSGLLLPFLWAFAALLVAVPVLMLFHAWVVDGTLSGGIAVGLMLGLLCGAEITLASQGSVMVLILGVLLIAGCNALVFAGVFTERKARRRLQNADIERLRRAIEFDNHNAGAHANLARELAALKQHDEAIHEYRTAISLLPDGPFSKSWKNDLKELLERRDAARL